MRVRVYTLVHPFGMVHWYHHPGTGDTEYTPHRGNYKKNNTMTIATTAMCKLILPTSPVTIGPVQLVHVAICGVRDWRRDTRVHNGNYGIELLQVCV